MAKQQTIKIRAAGGMDVATKNDVGGMTAVPAGDYVVTVERSWFDYETGQRYAGRVSEEDAQRIRAAGKTPYGPKDPAWNPARVFFDEDAIIRETTVYRVRLSTSHFEFEAFGATEGDAMMAFRKGWDAHAQATGAAAFESEEFARELFRDIETQAIKLGAFYRDRQEVQ